MYVMGSGQALFNFPRGNNFAEIRCPGEGSNHNKWTAETGIFEEWIWKAEVIEIKIPYLAFIGLAKMQN